MKNRPIGVYSEPSDSSFSLPRGGQGHSQFYSNSFFVYNTGSLLLSSLKKVTFPPFSPFPSSPRPRLPPQKFAPRA